MSVQNPLVSILINNYNYACFLRDAIDSALGQTYKNTEVILVDDGSTDDSREIIASYGSRIIPVIKENGGQASAFNEGFERATGDWIALLDSDDVFLANKVEFLLSCAEQHGDVGLIVHNLNYFNERGKDIDFPVMRISRRETIDLRVSVRRGKLKACLPATSGIFFRRDLLAKILPIPVDIRITADNFVKVAAVALSPFLTLPDPLAKQRIHSRNAYTGPSASENRELQQALNGAQISFHLRWKFPSLARIAWNDYGRILCRLRRSKAPDAKVLLGRVRSEYNLLEYSVPSLFYIGIGFAKALLSGV